MRLEIVARGDNIMGTIGTRLKSCREEWGYTQEQVEKATGVKRSNLANYETDFRTPRTETLQTLADFYGVSATYLLTGSEIYEKPDSEQTQALLQTLKGASEEDIALAVTILRAIICSRERKA